jgi:ferredoxin
MPYIATIEAGACAAHGDCEAIAPEIFAIEDVASSSAVAPTS